MAKKKPTPEEKWKWMEKIFNPDICTLSLSSLVSDGIAKKIVRFNKRIFDESEGEVLKGRVVSQEGPFVRVDIDGKIIEVELA